jgi:glucose-6-phosphate 1-dehydrogenase
LQNFVRIVPPPARILGGKNPERKTLFPFSRKNLSENEYRDNIRSYLNSEDNTDTKNFLDNVFYRQGDILDLKTYEGLKKELLERALMLTY